MTTVATGRCGGVHAGAFAQRAVAMPYRLEPGFGVKVAGAIDASRGGVGVFDACDRYVRRRRQVGFSVLRPQVMALALAPSSASAFGAESLGARHRRFD
jgi:hypothetical protein